jgi:hypothetical protein
MHLPHALDEQWLALSPACPFSLKGFFLFIEKQLLKKKKLLKKSVDRPPTIISRFRPFLMPLH